MFYQAISRKIIPRPKLTEQIRIWKSKGEKIVFTNGCFDLLHPGHVSYLAQARDLGDRLIVGVNADASVRRLKGAHRPIQTVEARMYVLAALACVDAVVAFDEDTPEALIATVLPDVLVKGGDWTPDRIAGADIVQRYGGIVMNLPFLQGYSTTLIEEKIKSCDEPPVS